MKVQVLRPYPGPGGLMRRPGEFVDEHPATAEGLVRRGLAVFFVPQHRAAGPTEFKPLVTGTGNPGLPPREAASDAPPTGAQLPEVGAPSGGERQPQAGASVAEAPAAAGTSTSKKTTRKTKKGKK